MGRVPNRFDATFIDQLERRVDSMAFAIKQIRADYTHFPLFDLLDNAPIKPQNGDVCLDYEEYGDPYYYYDGQWWPFTGRPSFEMKVFPDQGVGSAVAAGDDRFVFMIPDDVDAMQLYRARAYVTTVGSSGTTVQVRNRQVGDMLSTPLTIDASERNTYTAATEYVINVANAVVSMGDEIAIDVDVAGAGAKGLGVILQFKRVIP